MPDQNKQTGGSSTSVTAPGMNDILGSAKWLFNSGAAWAPDTSSHVTPFSTQTQNALKGITDVANSSRPAINANFNRVSATLADGGLNDLQDQQVNRLQGIAGGNGLNAQQQQGSDWLKTIAGGGDQNGNPFLDDMIKRGSQDIANSDNLMASLGGRYGSGSHTGVLGKDIADFAGNARYKDYSEQQTRKDSAIRDYFGMGTTGFGQQADAIGSLYNAGTAQRANQLAGTNQLQDAYNLRLSPMQAIGKVGSAYENKNQQILDDKSRIFRETQNGMTGPVDWLAKLANQYQGGTTTTPQTSNPVASALGGGMAGYDIFGGPIGAGAGALAGLFA